jgi:hypothetical protein
MVKAHGAWGQLRTIGATGILVWAFAILGGMPITCMGGWLDWLLPPLRNPCPNQIPPVNFSVSTQTTYTPRFTWGLLEGGPETAPLSGGASTYGLGQTGSVPVTPLIVFPSGERVRYLNTAPLYGYPLDGYLCVPSAVPRVWSLPGGVGNGYGGIPGSIVLPTQPSCSPMPTISWYPPLPGPAHGQGLPNGTGLLYGQGLPVGKGIPNGRLGLDGMGGSAAEGAGFAAPGFGGAYSVPAPSSPGPKVPALSVPFSPPRVFSMPGRAPLGVPGSASPGVPGSARPGVPGFVGPGVPTSSGPGIPGYGGPGVPGYARPALPVSGGPTAPESAGPRSGGPSDLGSANAPVGRYALPGSPSELPVPHPAGSPVYAKGGISGGGSSGPADPPGGGLKDTLSETSRSLPSHPPGLPQNNPLLNAPENLGESASGHPAGPPLVPFPGQKPLDRPTGTVPEKPNPKDRTT